MRASDPWFDTHLDVAMGQVVAVSATGELRDATIASHGPGGYPDGYMRLFNGLRRRPHDGWFELIGCVGKSLDHCLPIGKRTDPLVMPASGRLYLFVNDVCGFYWNNRGVLFVTLTPRPAVPAP